ncbi:SbcC/MukB-like Walker B domain-containing protein [Klenkia sp. LSe6-5]|uniref:SbcC/MukB-like Walker B domain-containing protein n=1 Tax=Klenkia sesuvii TaxID=3103137 RepID=A0ABU8DX30_9ACTN
MTERWRLHRAGIQNVWHYLDTEFVLTGGRMVLRGTNGSGKSRALELLLPFLLDADRRRMDSSGSAAVNLDRLMRVGDPGTTNRVGYLWLELIQGMDRYLTLGAHLRWSANTGSVTVSWFLTELRVGHELRLLDPDRHPLRREDLAQLLGPDVLTTVADTHRERVRERVFGLVDAQAGERFDGLTQLLHTLRSPDVGNRIDEGRLPALLSDALPPLSQATLDAAGSKLDEISETRALQDRLERSVADLETFLAAYRRYAQGELGAATDRTRVAVRELTRAEKRDAATRAALTTAESDDARAEAQLAQCREQLVEVQATLVGLQQSADRQDLLERARTVTAHRGTADQAAGRADDARRGEDAAADRLTRVARTAIEVAGRTSERMAALAERARDAGVPDPLPGEVVVRMVEEVGAVEAVRLQPDLDAEPVGRPTLTGLDLGGVDLDAWRAGAGVVRQAARDRRQQLDARWAEHRRLAGAEGVVVQAERSRDDAVGREQEAGLRRDDAVDAENAARTSLRERWSAWTQAPETVAQLGGVDWSVTPVGAWLAEGPDDLDALDGAAADAAVPAIEELQIEAAELRVRVQERRMRVTGLEAERTALLAERDPEPARPPWSGPVDGVPLWRSVDFRAGLTTEVQAGLEAALLASGLLTAVVRADGAAADGELLVDAGGPTAARPLSQVLVPDPDGGLPSGQVAAVLDRIGWGDRSGPCWVDADGSFRLGALTGRHTAPHARHIGTTARARHRAEELARVDAELAALADELARLGTRASSLAAAVDAVRAHVRTAPRSTALRETITRRGAAEADVAREAATAQRLARAAAEQRARWDVEQARHAELCGRLGVPADEQRLATARERAGQTTSEAESVSVALGDLARAVQAVAAEGAALDEARGSRVAAEAAAERDRERWHVAATELAAAELAAGLDADAARAELRAAEQAVSAAQIAVRDADRDRLAALGTLTRAQGDAATAAAAVAQAREAAGSADELLRRRAQLPGLAEAAGIGELPAAGSLVDVLTAGLPDPVPEPDPDAYLKALLRLENQRDPGDYDLLTRVEDGVNLVEIGEAAGRRPLPAAVAELVRRRDLGRSALTEREQRVFTTFVLGSVADELRHQLQWSTQQVERMNARLAGIRTSHGIGVEIRWPLADDVAGSAARIEELVLQRSSARAADATAELTALLRARVEEELRTDPAQGYATALRAALDHRSWHEVQVFIVGPGDAPPRKISRRARLSQGETRVVSYLALFAAADAFFTGLPSPEALRLILLDDAFAKVDERTIGELMAQLVRLDLDFVMTGHALWGFGPDVPSLDVYEVRRAEGTAAITTRVHWDGTTRHVFT